MISIPLPLLQSVESGSCVLFLGAGIGHHLTRDGATMPDGTQLARDLSRHFELDTDGSVDLSEVAQFVELAKEEPHLMHLSERPYPGSSRTTLSLPLRDTNGGQSLQPTMTTV